MRLVAHSYNNDDEKGSSVIQHDQVFRGNVQDRCEMGTANGLSLLEHNIELLHNTAL